MELGLMLETGLLLQNKYIAIIILWSWVVSLSAFIESVLERQSKRGIPPPPNPAADKSGRALQIAISKGSQRAGVELSPSLKECACQKIKQWMPSCLILTF